VTSFSPLDFWGYRLLEQDSDILATVSNATAQVSEVQGPGLTGQTQESGIQSQRL